MLNRPMSRYSYFSFLYVAAAIHFFDKLNHMSTIYELNTISFCFFFLSRLTADFNLTVIIMMILYVTNAFIHNHIHIAGHENDFLTLVCVCERSKQAVALSYTELLIK